MARRWESLADRRARLLALARECPPETEGCDRDLAAYIVEMERYCGVWDHGRCVSEEILREYDPAEYEFRTAKTTVENLEECYRLARAILDLDD